MMEAGYENVDDLLQNGCRVTCNVEKEAFTKNIRELKQPTFLTTRAAPVTSKDP